ncbi:MAG: hypothetical protein WC712_08030 [Candidatus Brocadiia bacterium]
MPSPVGCLVGGDWLGAEDLLLFCLLDVTSGSRTGTFLLSFAQTMVLSCYGETALSFLPPRVALPWAATRDGVPVE